jgi:hypothetical protein
METEALEMYATAAISSAFNVTNLFSTPSFNIAKILKGKKHHFQTPSFMQQRP